MLAVKFWLVNCGNMSLKVFYVVVLYFSAFWSFCMVFTVVLITDHRSPCYFRSTFKFKKPVPTKEPLTAFDAKFLARLKEIESKTKTVELKSGRSMCPPRLILKRQEECVNYSAAGSLNRRVSPKFQIFAIAHTDYGVAVFVEVRAM